jgi:hypothetical protein
MALKNKSPEVGATTKEAIDNSNQDDITHDNSVNQYPKHISFFLANIVEQMSQAMLLEDAHD